VVKVGQEIKVKVLEIDLERKRLALSCKQDSPVVGKHHSRPNTKRASQPRKKIENVNTAFAVLKNFKVK